MKEPRRLLVDSQTSELSRSLLAAGRARREPEGARERVWGAVAVGLAGGATTAAATGSAAPGASAGASASMKDAGIALALTKTKLLVAGAVIATAALVTVVTMRPDEPVAAAAVVPAALAPTATDSKPEASAEMKLEADPEATLPEPKPRPRPQPTMTAAPTMNAGAPQVVVKTSPGEGEAAPPVAISRLREEAALLQEARAALARGDRGSAHAKLDEARARFPKSQLAQERDALEVRLASASGDRQRTASLARAFVERYPDSPLRAGVESIARAAEKL